MTQGWILRALPLQRATVRRSSGAACGTRWSVNRRTVRGVRKTAIVSAVAIALAPLPCVQTVLGAIVPRHAAAG
jgi:hypothetical protein